MLLYGWINQTQDNKLDIILNFIVWLLTSNGQRYLHLTVFKVGKLYNQIPLNTLK
jgi:hypothetical protein